jgi:UDP-3-O-[3-hydroxymyristoyl] glucosamine N-acyltransferase
VKLGQNVSIGAHTVIESGVQIGDQTQIGPLCFIGKDTIIGKNTKLYPHVTVREETQIGNQVILHSGAVVGSDGFGYATRGGIHHKIPQIGTVEIGDDVEIGANVTIDRATLGKTIIGKGSKIDNLVQIAHNVQIGEGCILVSQAGVAGSSQLGKYVTLAGQVGVVGHVKLGDQVIAAAQSGIPNDVPAGSVVFGSPARPIQEERKIQVIIGKLPKIYEEFKKIKKRLELD